MRKPTDAAESEFGSTTAASLGGRARASSLSDDERRESASNAARARWERAGKPMVPRATHVGTLSLGALACAVLENGTRVISERGFLSALGIKFGGALSAARKAGDGAAELPMFVGYKNLRPFIDNDLTVLLQSPVLYRVNSGGQPGHGVRAELIPKVLNVWLRARDAGALTKHQQRVAEKADILMRGLAEVGIVALVDEATGYQADRARDALAKILEAFIAKELRPWAKTFRSDFYEQLLRLRGLKFDGTLKQPRYIGTLTDNIVYKRLAPGIRDELKRLNPANAKGQRKHKHFQWLTQQLGYQRLEQHLAAVTALMRAFDDYEHFKVALDRALPLQTAAPLFDNVDKDGARLLPAPVDVVPG